MREVEIWGGNRDLVTQLSASGAKFFIFGGTATRFYAPERREPNDLDLMVEPSAEMLTKLNTALVAVGAQPILATPEQFSRGNCGARSKDLLSVDILTPPTGVDFAEHWGVAEEATMHLTTTRVRVAAISTLELLLRLGQQREPPRAQALGEDLAWLARAKQRPR